MSVGRLDQPFSQLLSVFETSATKQVFYKYLENASLEEQMSGILFLSNPKLIYKTLFLSGTRDEKEIFKLVLLLSRLFICTLYWLGIYHSQLLGRTFQMFYPAICEP